MEFTFICQPLVTCAIVGIWATSSGRATLWCGSDSLGRVRREAGRVERLSWHESDSTHPRHDRPVGDMGRMQLHELGC